MRHLTKLLILAAATLVATLALAGVEPPADPAPEATPAATPAPAPKPEKTPRPSGSYDGKKNGPGWAHVTIGGETMTVRWSDGDSFKFKDGPYEGSGVRLTAYNTLESYGPVHRWGKWTAQELYAIASHSKDLASSQDWDCTTTGERDGYRRLLVSCPGVALHMVSAGHAHVFGIDDPVAPELLAAQKTAQKKKVGMWAKGVPDVIITSLHSADEGWEDGAEGPYNRVADARTGMSEKRHHHDVYATCQEVCVGSRKGQACMTYVPFKNRYRNKPDCLKGAARDDDDE
jgi:micrococcal nuclease